jgi:hypothetical protein
MVPFCAALLLLLVASGCEGGRLSGHEQRCSSTGGLFSGESMTCTGTVETLSGQVGIDFGDEDLTGDRRLALTVSAERGEAEVYAYGPDDERIAFGRLAPGETVRADAIVDPHGDDTVFYVDAGEGEIGGLEYEGSIGLP